MAKDRSAPIIGKIIREALLEASESPRKARYRLWIEQVDIGFLVRKESGCQGRVLHSESYFRIHKKEANETFERLLRQKTEKKLKRIRTYSIVNLSEPTPVHE